MTSTITKNSDFPILDAEVSLDKRRLLIVFFSGFLIVTASIAAMVWALINWDEHSRKCLYIFSGEEFDCGLAPKIYGWAITFIVLIPLVFFLIALTLDFKRPVLGVNRHGLFINHKLFRRTFLTWEEFGSAKKLDNGSIELIFSNPEEVVGRQPVHFRYFLKTTYLKKRLPFIIDPELKNQNILRLVARYMQLKEKEIK